LSVRHVQSTPAGLRAPDPCGAAAWPLVSEQQRLPREVFRRSIAWLSDWLSTLRGAGYPRPAQDSLPAAGQALPGGLSTRRVPLKGFRGRFPTSHPPFPSFLPQSDRPTHSRSNLAARCPSVLLSPSTRERLPNPMAHPPGRPLSANGPTPLLPVRQPACRASRHGPFTPPLTAPCRIDIERRHPWTCKQSEIARFVF
jgi:hypothetical protein